MSAFNADEIVSIGVEIEKNGRAFYLRAAAQAESTSVRAVFEKLAAWESEHVITFEKIKETLPSQDAIQGGWYEDEAAEAYFKAVAESHIFIKNRSMDDIFAQCPTERSALTLALQFEKESIALYEALLELMGHSLGGRKEVLEIIAEEQSHVLFIENALSQLAL